MNCKGVPKPNDNYYTTGYVSAIYSPVTVFGNLFLILTIVADPLRELRTRFNLFFLNSIAADLVLGLFVDSYRAWGNYLRGTGVNTGKTYPDRKYLSKLCHVVFFGSQIVGFFTMATLFTDRILHHKYGNKKSSNKIIAFVSAGIWSFGVGLGLFYQLYGYTIVEWVVIGTVSVTSVVILAAAFIFFYLPARAAVDGSATTPNGLVVQGNETSTKSTDFDTMDKTKPVGETKDIEETPISEFPSVRIKSSKPDSDDGSSSSLDAKLKLENAEKLLVIYVVLFLFAVTAGVLVFMVNYKAAPTCISAYWVKDMKTLVVCSYRAFNPYLCLLLIPSFRRGLLCLLRFRKIGAVAPSKA
eukprot:Seg2605.4 transcript_id=Seg2605.4/GoldUCD/mRNA.D3Y31 product="hypothetical protein" protein_id=Seg2605.4/GoldUCD/D3Y31